MEYESAQRIGERVREVLSQLSALGGILPQEFLSTTPHPFDFSKDNPKLKAVDMHHPRTLGAYIEQTLAEAGCTWGMGGYGERRSLYESSDLFKKGDEFRSIHLGVDAWMPAGTELRAPLSGKIHSLQNNRHFLDYGNTIILEHETNGVVWYTLWGHLGAQSLEGKKEGTEIEQGGLVGTVGDYPENGSWPPHLHFQIIGDMLGLRGDFPGVATPSESAMYLALCPSPERFFTAQGVLTQRSYR